MPLTRGYAVLKGIVVDLQRATGGSPHYQLRVVDDQLNYRLAVNVRSSVHPQELESLLLPSLHHPIVGRLAALPLGLTRPGETWQERRASGLALDYIRMNLFERTRGKPPQSLYPGPDNDLNDKLDAYVEYAMGDENNRVYAFGEPWSEPGAPDRVFGFAPGNGIHDIHMNQGNALAEYVHENSLYQDGGLIFHFAAENRYAAYFSKFQSQTWHSDGATGNALGGDADHHDEPDNAVRIVAALLNPLAGQRECVTLLNTTAQPVSLADWKLADEAKNKQPLSGTIPAGQTLQVAVEAPLRLGNQGGIISVLNHNGWKVHGVSYTGAQVADAGVTIVFSG